MPSTPRSSEAADCHLAFALSRPGDATILDEDRAWAEARDAPMREQRAGAWSLHVRPAAGSLPWSNLRPQDSTPTGWPSSHCKSCLTERGSVTRIMVMSTLSLAAVKAHFSQVIDEVAGTHERVTVTKNGSPVAVILAVEDLESLLETLEILSDRSAVADIREAEQQMAQGQIFSEEQVRAAVTNRRLP